MKAVITTLGTSMLRNFFNETSQQLPKWLYEPVRQSKEYRREINEFTNALYTWFNDVEMSAESATLSQLPQKNLRFYFLASDSIATVVVAEVLQRFYKRVAPSIQTEIRVIYGLSMKDKNSFERGIDSLIIEVLKILKKEKDVIFNITAGYKGVIPYFSTIAQIFNAKLIYDFEGIQNRLITIDPLPIEFDRSFFELLYPYLVHKNFKDPKIARLLKELKIVTPKKELTPLGHIILFAAEKQMMNKSALGYFIEYLLYAYISQKGSFQEFHFHNIEVGKKFQNKAGSKTLSDVDIYMENDAKIFWLEVKPVSLFVKPSALKKQFFQRQLRVIRNLPKPLYRYGVIFYGLDKKPPHLHGAIKKFAHRLRQNGIASGFYYFPLSLKIDKNMLTPQNYQSLIQRFEISRIDTIFETV